MVGGVERIYGLAGQEPSVLALLGHAPAHRGDPARFVQHPQHLQPVLCHAQDGRQVGHAGQGHPGDYPEESSLFLVQWSPPHYRRPPLSGASIPAQAGVGLPAGWPGRLSRRCGQRLEGEYPNFRYSIYVMRCKEDWRSYSRGLARRTVCIGDSPSVREGVETSPTPADRVKRPGARRK